MEIDREDRKEPEFTEVYLQWRSPSRLFKRRDREYFTNIGAIVFFLTVILIFAREFVLVAAVLSIVFLIYVLSTVPPEDVDHRMTNMGIESAGHFYRWEELAEFWFEDQWGQTKFTLRPVIGPLIVILVGSANSEEIRKIAEKHIAYRETPQKSWVDNTATWLAKKIPLEKPE
jgi:hypothetical protein